MPSLGLKNVLFDFIGFENRSQIDSGDKINVSVTVERFDRRFVINSLKFLLAVWFMIRGKKMHKKNYKIRLFSWMNAINLWWIQNMNRLDTLPNVFHCWFPNLINKVDFNFWIMEINCAYVLMQTLIQRWIELTTVCCALCACKRLNNRQSFFRFHARNLTSIRFIFFLLLSASLNEHIYMNVTVAQFVPFLYTTLDVDEVFENI